MTKNFDLRSFLIGFFALVVVWLVTLRLGSQSSQVRDHITAELPTRQALASDCHGNSRNTFMTGNSSENFELKRGGERFDDQVNSESYQHGEQEQEILSRSSHSGMKPHELERSISEILIDGLTDEQINSFIEGPTDAMASSLKHEAHLIPSVLDKIKVLETSTERDYLIALIGGLPEQQRLPAIEQLATSHRLVDQKAAIALYKSGNINSQTNSNEDLLELYHHLDDQSLRLQVLSALNITQGIDSDIFNELMFQLSSDDSDTIRQSLSIIKTWFEQSGNTFNYTQRNQLGTELGYIAGDSQLQVDTRISALHTLKLMGI